MRHLLVLYFCSVCGCVTASSIKSDPAYSGTTRLFKNEPDKVIIETRAALPEVGLTIKSDEAGPEGSRVIVAERGVTGQSWGEVVRAIIQPAPQSQTSVRVLTQRAFFMNASAKTDFTDEVLTRIGQRLGTYP